MDENKAMKAKLGILEETVSDKPMSPRLSAANHNNTSEDTRPELTDKDREIEDLQRQLKDASLLSWRTMSDKL
jgi:hypothetical protein